MKLFRRKDSLELEIIKIQSEIIQQLLDDIFIENPNPVRLVLTTIINNSKFQIMALTLASNQNVQGTLSLIDTVTNQLVTATFANVAATSDTPAAFTASVDSSNNVNVSAVAVGTGTLTVSSTVSYTDSTGAAQTIPLTFTVAVTITAVVGADSVSLQVTFGTPTQQ